MPGADTAIEIRRVHAAEDFGTEATTELREQEVRLRARTDSTEPFTEGIARIQDGRVIVRVHRQQAGSYPGSYTVTIAAATDIQAIKEGPSPHHFDLSFK